MVLCEPNDEKGLEMIEVKSVEEPIQGLEEEEQEVSCDEEVSIKKLCEDIGKNETLREEMKEVLCGEQK